MSNLTVLDRLESQLSEYELGSVSRRDFVQFLTSSIEALEGVPYKVRLQLREHERAIETEGHFEEEGFESKSASARSELKDWIKQLKAAYGSIQV